jgi:hypothetical protein
MINVVSVGIGSHYLWVSLQDLNNAGHGRRIEDIVGAQIPNVFTTSQRPPSV